MAQEVQMSHDADTENRRPLGKLGSNLLLRDTHVKAYFLATAAVLTLFVTTAAVRAAPQHGHGHSSYGQHHGGHVSRTNGHYGHGSYGHGRWNPYYQPSGYGSYGYGGQSGHRYSQPHYSGHGHW